MDSQTTGSSFNMESYSLRNMYLSVFVVKTVYLYLSVMLAWSSSMIPDLEESLLQFSTLDKMAILASLPLGMTLGPSTGCYLVPRYGFKSVFLQFCCLGLASVLLLAFRQMLVICIARLLSGIALGSVLCYVEAYIQDISDPEVRKIMNTFSLVFLTLGFFLVYDIGQMLMYSQILLVLLIVPVALLACLLWLPESPYVHVAAGNLDKAKRSVDFLHRGISTRGLDRLMRNIQDTMTRRETDGNDYTNIPPYHKSSKAANVNLMLFTLLPLTGFPVMFMLMESVVSEAQQSVGVGRSLSAIARTNLCPIPIVLVLNYYCSHKPKLIVTSGIMSISMAGLGSYVFNSERGKDVSFMDWLPLVCTVVYTTAFLVGFTLKSDEAASNPRLRDSGRVLALSAGCFTMFLVTLLYLPLKELLGLGPILWIFAVFSSVLIMLNVFCSPETTLF